MRIIAGYLGGRNFDAPKGHRTHPMSEKARGGLFSALGDIKGLSILDAFAGSGAISIEAISRGAIQAVAIDIDKSAIDTIKKNIKILNIDNKIKTVRAAASGWSNNNQNHKFDIIVCDPPYGSPEFNTLDKLTRHLKSEGVFVLSWPGKEESPKILGLKIVKTKEYGDAKLIFYKH